MLYRTDSQITHSKIFVLLCVVGSALLFSAGFLAPEYFWWTSVLFLVPLFFLFYTQAHTLSYIHGFLWGLIAFGTHSYGIFYSVARMADTQPWYLPFLCLGAVIYLAIYSSIWFGLSSLLIRLVNFSSLLITISIVSSTLVYFFFIDQVALWPLHRLEGYPLVHPLVPLAQYPQVLMPLRFLGSFGMLALLVFTQALLAQALTTHRYPIHSILTILTSILVYTLWCITSLYAAQEQLPNWLSQVVILAQAFYNPDDPGKTVQQVTEHLKQIQARYPQARALIMPESALFLCNLPAQPTAITAYSAVLHPENILITGGLYAPQPTEHYTKHYNAIYILDNFGIRAQFCKRHAMALTEQLSCIWDATPLRSLYYTKRPAITPSHNKRPVIQLMPDISVVPYICSELFFTYYPDDNYSNTPILALCNDSWLIPAYAKKLMYLYVHFKALVWQRPIIYVAYDYAYYLDKNMRQPLTVYTSISHVHDKISA